MALNTCSIAFQITVVDTLTMDGAGSPTITYNDFNSQVSLTGSTTPPATQVYAEQLTGVNNLDFTALARDARSTLDASGLKLQAILVNNLSTTDDLVLSDGAANAYPINGGVDVTIPPLGKFQAYYRDGLDDVGATKKMFDVENAVGESCQVILVFG